MTIRAIAIAALASLVGAIISASPAYAPEGPVEAPARVATHNDREGAREPLTQRP